MGRSRTRKNLSIERSLEKFVLTLGMNVSTEALGQDDGAEIFEEDDADKELAKVTSSS